MLSPSPQTVLRGLREALEQDVLPVLDDGVAVRQLRAGLHILSRLERVTPDPAAYLREDNDDMAVTIRDVLALGWGDGPAKAVSAERLEDLAGHSGDEDFEALYEAHRGLLELLGDVGHAVRSSPPADERVTALARLHELYERMLARQDVAWGTAAAEGER